MDWDLEGFKNHDVSPAAHVWAAEAAKAYQPGSEDAKLQSVVCIGHFNGPPPPEALHLHPPQLGLNGGLAVFNQNCDDPRLQGFGNFKPATV